MQIRMTPLWICRPCGDQRSGGIVLLPLYCLEPHFFLSPVLVGRRRSHRRKKSRNQALSRYYAKLQVLPILIKRVLVELAAIRRVERLMHSAFVELGRSLPLCEHNHMERHTFVRHPYLFPIPASGQHVPNMIPKHDSDTNTRQESDRTTLFYFVSTL